jgi:hypothetical protein
MDPENFAVAYSVLVLGFAVGISTAKLCSNYYFDEMKNALERAKSKVFNKDKQIDELRQQNEELRKRYEELYEVKEYMSSILDRTTHLPPPPNTPIERSRFWSDGMSEFESIDDSETSSTD